MIVNKRFDDPDKRQEDDPQDAKDVFRDKLLTSDNVIPKRRLPANLMISFFI